MRLFQVSKRPVLLLEVLIAFTLVVLCALPLIYPHVFILKSEKEYVATVELDHIVNLLFANRLQKLYLNEIPWNEIEDGKEMPIDEGMLKDVGYESHFPFTGTYQFVELKKKPPQPEDKALYLYRLIFSFTPKTKMVNVDKDKPLKYEYNVFIERRIK